MNTRIEAQAARDLTRWRAEIGPSEAADRFVHCYPKVRIQRLYTFHLWTYFRRLRKKGVEMTSDQLVADNLHCIYRSEPENVAAKKRRGAWLEDYINRFSRRSAERLYR